MDKQIIREAILDVIDEDDPRFKPAKESTWSLYHENEDFANRQRLDFANAVQARIEMKLAMNQTEHLDDAKNIVINGPVS